MDLNYFNSFCRFLLLLNIINEGVLNDKKESYKILKER